MNTASHGIARMTRISIMLMASDKLHDHTCLGSTLRMTRLVDSVEDCLHALDACIWYYSVANDPTTITSLHGRS